MELSPGDPCPMCKGQYNGNGKIVDGPKFSVRVDTDIFPPLQGNIFNALRYKCNKCGYAIEVKIAQAKDSSGRAGQP